MWSPHLSLTRIIRRRRHTLHTLPTVKLLAMNRERERGIWKEIIGFIVPRIFEIGQAVAALGITTIMIITINITSMTIYTTTMATRTTRTTRMVMRMAARVSVLLALALARRRRGGDGCSRIPRRCGWSC